MAPGGAERVVVTLAGGSSRDVAVASADGPLRRELPCPWFELPLVVRRPDRLGLAAWRLRRALRTWRPSIVHCHNPGAALVARLAIGPVGTPRALVSVHGVTEADRASAARVLRAARMPVVACGTGVAHALRSSGVDVVETIANGITPPPAPAPRFALAEELGVSESAPLVVSAGRLVALKNVDVAIGAVAAVPDAVLLVVGDGPQRPELERIAVASGAADRVVFAGHRPDARRLIGAADAVVLASSSEGQPLVVIEALMAGIPLVASDLPGVRELVGADAALLVQPGDVEGVADALRRVLSDRALARRLAAAGRTAAAPYSASTMIHRFDALYATLATS